MSPTDVVEPPIDEVAPEGSKDGEIGGACYGNGTCNEGLICNSLNLCERAQGAQGAPCYGNGTCNEGLTCNEDNICIVTPGETPVEVDLCGNSEIDQGEECDDGNRSNGDGCNLRCALETLTPLDGDEPYVLASGSADAQVAFSACDDEGSTGSYAPGEPISVNVCLIGYLDDESHGPTVDQLRADFELGASFFSASNTGINLVLSQAVAVEGTPAQTDPNSTAEVDQYLENLRTYADMTWPGSCDVVIGYSNSIRVDPLTPGAAKRGIGGRATWPSAGLHTAIVKHNNRPGRTLAHELGHVFGLYHTHQGGVRGSDGDGCSDTLFDDRCTEESGCDLMCQDGRDIPSENVMSYYGCLEPRQSSFSACQSRRARCFIAKMFSECIETNTRGEITDPSDGATVGSSFTVRGQLTDAQGVELVTITVDDRQDPACKVSQMNATQSDTEFSFAVEIDLEACGVSYGEHTIGLWMRNRCTEDVRLIDSVNIVYEAGCSPEAERRCDGDSIYWYDSCGARGELIETCPARTACESDAQGVSCRDQCVCDSGVCCDGCQYHSRDVVCEESTEYQCSGSACGADPQRRINSQRCSGDAATCTGDVTAGLWEDMDQCATDEVCIAESDTARCLSCSDGCGDGQCLSCTDEASSGCVNNSIYWYDSCGAQGQLRRTCGANEECVEDGDDASCVSTCECDSGSCCDGCNYRPATHICDAEYDVEYRCESDSCGGDAQHRVTTRKCSGRSAQCSGATDRGAWTDLEQCGSSSICVLGRDDASCQTCDDGCSQGECNDCCEISTQPADDQWTPFIGGSCPTIGGGFLYIMKVTNISYEHNNAGEMLAYATIRVEKSDGSRPSQNISIWLVTAGDDTDSRMSCSDRHAYVERRSGTWRSTQSSYEFTRVPIWPNAECSVLPLNSPGYGTGKALGVITGGAGFNDERIWMSSHTLRFTKSACQ